MVSEVVVLTTEFQALEASLTALVRPSEQSRARGLVRVVRDRIRNNPNPEQVASLCAMDHILGETPTFHFTEDGFFRDILQAWVGWALGNSDGAVSFDHHPDKGVTGMTLHQWASAVKALHQQDL